MLYKKIMELITNPFEIFIRSSESMAEDMHMFLKTYFQTRGKLKAIPIYSPASSCNVEGGLRGRFSQAVRHMFASIDLQYTLRNTFLHLLDPIHGIPQSTLLPPTPLHIPWPKLVRLVYRQIESHILVPHVHLFILLMPWGAAALPSDSTVRYLIDFCGFLRHMGVPTLLVTIYFFEAYHDFAAYARWHGTKTLSHDDKKLGQRPVGSMDSRRRTWTQVLGWAWFPVCGILFFAVPSIYVMLLLLWSDSLEYRVALKPASSVDSKAKKK
jgi:hypothetical protein